MRNKLTLFILLSSLVVLSSCFEDDNVVLSNILEGSLFQLSVTESLELTGDENIEINVSSEENSNLVASIDLYRRFIGSSGSNSYELWMENVSLNQPIPSNLTEMLSGLTVDDSPVLEADIHEGDRVFLEAAFKDANGAEIITNQDLTASLTFTWPVWLAESVSYQITHLGFPSSSPNDDITAITALEDRQFRFENFWNGFNGNTESLLFTETEIGVLVAERQSGQTTGNEFEATGTVESNGSLTVTWTWYSDFQDPQTVTSFYVPLN